MLRARLKSTVSALSSSSVNSFRRGRDLSQQLVFIYGLVEEIIGAAHDPAHAVVVTVQAGEQYDGNQAGFWIGLHGLTNFEAARARHYHIQQDEINRVGLQMLQRL